MKENKNEKSQLGKTDVDKKKASTSKAAKQLKPKIGTGPVAGVKPEAGAAKIKTEGEKSAIGSLSVPARSKAAKRADGTATAAKKITEAKHTHKAVPPTGKAGAKNAAKAFLKGAAKTPSKQNKNAQTAKTNLKKPDVKKGGKLADKNIYNVEKTTKQQKNSLDDDLINAAKKADIEAKRAAFFETLNMKTEQENKEKLANDAAERKTNKIDEEEQTQASDEKKVQGADVPEKSTADLEKAAAKHAKKEKKKKLAKEKKEKNAKAKTTGLANSQMLDDIGQTSSGSFLGEIFYSLGFFAECQILRILRILNEFGVLIHQMLTWLFGGISKFVKNGFALFWQSTTAPFVRFKNGVKNIRRVLADEKKSGEGKAFKRAIGYFRVGVKNHAYLLLRMAGFLLPIVALSLFAVTVYSLLNIEYALEVKSEGKLLGYIEDQAVLEDAKNMLRGRLKLSSDEARQTWQFNPQLSIGRANKLTTKKQLVNAILQGAEFDIVQATGLYVEGELFAVTTEGKRLQKFLDDRLNEVKKDADENSKVEFIHNLEYVSDTDDVFLKSGIIDYEQLEKSLLKNDQEEIWYSVAEEKSLNEVAHENNVQISTLLQLNPQALEGVEADGIVEEGTRLLIQQERAFLDVKTTIRRERQEEIPFKIIEKKSDEYDVGTRKKEQEGINGVQTLSEDFVYVKGGLVSTTVVDELTTVIQQPQEEIVFVGTHEFYYGLSGKFRPGAYVDPVPGSNRSSRGMSAGHRGRDINAPAGTPIYAANAGTVITSGSHYSFGLHVVIQHPDGLQTLYAHASELLVTAGQEVGQGEIIAKVGSTGNSTGNHCHLEFSRNGGLLNPDDYVTGRWRR